MSKNRAEIDGHLGADPEIRTGQSGARVMTFRVGTSERWTDKSGEKQERTHWHSVVCFQAWIIDAIGHRLQKGSRVHVEGRWRPVIMRTRTVSNAG